MKGSGTLGINDQFSFLKYLARVQGIYMLVTACWAILHIESFMAVTGPKTDIWLVKTVAALLIPMGSVLLIFSILGGDLLYALIIGLGSSLMFLIIDFYYVSIDVISGVYLLDGIVQISCFGSWIFVMSPKYFSLIKPKRTLPLRRL